MRRRQSIPGRWLVANGKMDRQFWLGLKQLPRGSGVLLLNRPSRSALRRLHNLAALRGLLIVAEAPFEAARVHNIRELRQSLLRRTAFVLLSPMFETSSHADWKPLPRMRAASLARLGKRRLIALGGMNEGRYRKIAQLGFIGWAGISAWLPG